MLLAHDIEGSGEPALFLHSAVCDRRSWQPQWDLLRDAGYRVIRADFRGYGETPAPTEPFDNAADVRDLLDAHGIEQATLVGSSFGGRIAIEVAARWPERVTDLALLCAALDYDPPTDAVRAFGRREGELLEAGDIEAAVELNLETFLGPSADAATRAFVGDMQRHNFEVQLPAPEVPESTVDHDITAITARTLVVAGAHDVDYFQIIAQHLVRNIPGAQYVLLDWAGHLPGLEDPTRLNPILLDFLKASDH
jgi:3-oxoadipate enol-lactonase